MKDFGADKFEKRDQKERFANNPSLTSSADWNSVLPTGNFRECEFRSAER